MYYFSICLDLSEKICIVIGGGKVAERKVLGLLEGGAQVTVISPDLTEKLQTLAERRQIDLLQRPYEEGDLQGAFLAISATDDPAVQKKVHEEACRLNILLNVADVPELCNFILPATLRRGDLSISVSTAGKSPALASRIRRQLESQFGPEYETYVRLLGLLRPLILGLKSGHRQNREIFHSLLHDSMIEWIRQRQWNKIKKHLEKYIDQQTVEDCLIKALTTPTSENNQGAS
jgi:precorrin-2 dehydrogenase/sirohydrochlorin ferrochelatase